MARNQQCLHKPQSRVSYFGLQRPETTREYRGSRDPLWRRGMESKSPSWAEATHEHAPNSSSRVGSLTGVLRSGQNRLILLFC